MSWNTAPLLLSFCRRPCDVQTAPLSPTSQPVAPQERPQRTVRSPARIPESKPTAGDAEHQRVGGWNGVSGQRRGRASPPTAGSRALRPRPRQSRPVSRVRGRYLGAPPPPGSRPSAHALPPGGGCEADVRSRLEVAGLRYGNVLGLRPLGPGQKSEPVPKAIPTLRSSPCSRAQRQPGARGPRGSRPLPRPDPAPASPRPPAGRAPWVTPPAPRRSPTAPGAATGARAAAPRPCWPRSSSAA